MDPPDRLCSECNFSVPFHCTPSNQSDFVCIALPTPEPSILNRGLWLFPTLQTLIHIVKWNTELSYDPIRASVDTFTHLFVS